MLVAVRTPRIEFEVKGTTVPDDVIDFFRKKFGDKNVSVDDEEYILAEDMPEFRQFKAEETPGKTIRFYRKMMGLTQAQLGQRLGVTDKSDKMTVSRMERDVQPVGKKTALRMSRLFHISVGRLIV